MALPARSSGPRFLQWVFSCAAVAALLVACATAPLDPPPRGEDPPPTRPPGSPPPATTRNWSDAASWPGGSLPQAGDQVTIAAGQVVLLDISPPPLGGLAIDGALVFADQDLELRSDWIMVHGALHVGSADQPFRHQATITLTGPDSDEDVMQFMGTKVLGAMHGGVIQLYGLVEGPSWTRLSEHAAIGDDRITVLDASGWRVGDEIVIASTDYEQWTGEGHDRRDRQVEERTIVAIEGAVLRLDRALDHPHVGRSEVIAGVTVDQRAEVARLSRNVVVQGDEASAEPGSDRFRFGGHVMVMNGSVGIFEGVEFRRMGQLGREARYPVHYHLLRDGGADSTVASSSIHHSYHRCLTIHGTNGLRVYDVAAYDSYGHCFFLEDAAETGNLLQRNLALMVRRIEPEHAILPSDSHPYIGPAAFWITNPANDLIDNVAASSAGTGFWYALPERPTGLFYTLYGDQGIVPRRTPLGRFEGNVAHSNNSIGLHVDNGPSTDLLHLPVTSYQPRSDPGDWDSEPVTAVFQDFVAYRHRDAGAWFRGDHTLLRGGVLSDNAIGVTFASHLSGAEGVAFIGESSNLGHAWPWEPVGLDGRTLPRPWHEDDDGGGYVIRGFEFYDGEVWVRESRFARYVPNAQRQAAALAYKDYTDWPVSPLNAAEDLWFEAGTNRVRFTSREVGQGSNGEDGYRSAVFHDLDGSVTGSAGRVVTFDSAFLLGAGCSMRTDWNARVCNGRYASLTIDRVQGSADLAPVVLRRSDGPEHTMLGAPSSQPRTYFRTLLRLDDSFSYAYDFSGGADQLRINLQDVQAGDRLLVSLPWEGSAPFIYRDWWIDERNLLPVYTSLSALLATNEPGYFHDGSTLHLRLVQQQERSYAEVEVCRRALCS